MTKRDKFEYWIYNTDFNKRMYSVVRMESNLLNFRLHNVMLYLTLDLKQNIFVIELIDDENGTKQTNVIFACDDINPRPVGNHDWILEIKGKIKGDLILRWR